jgi:dTDP-4-dehydrorhamnose reductase
VGHARVKYLLTGREGQLARAFIQRFEAHAIDYLAPEESALDIADATVVRRCVAEYRPDIIINCAAYNLVDLAEEERDKALTVNAHGPRVLASAASEYHAQVVHFGSDYVFDGLKEDGLYSEQDAAAPLSHYGKSKLLGEQNVQKECQEHLVLRLSWVFGRGKQNFISKLLQWSQTQKFLRVAHDEFSVPTSVDTVVDVTLSALDQGLRGLYHVTNGGYCSRFEWARLVLDTLAVTKFVRPVSMDIYHLPAKRPKFSAMSHARIAQRLGLTIPTWQEAVIAFLRDNKGIYG